MNTCFAVCGNHPKLSKEERSALWATNIQEPIRSVITFDFEGDLPEAHVWWSLKRWREIKQNDFAALFEEVNFLAIADDYDGMQFKRAYKLKRFKFVPINKTDKDIVEKWVELIRLDEQTETRGLVEYYHDIARPEKIEFEKPVSGMQVGMMPVKLNQMMINMAVGRVKSEEWEEESTEENTIRHSEHSEESSEPTIQKHFTPSWLTIYDPFCGFGTTWFVWQLSGHHFIWSDSNPTPAKQNLPRRNEIFPESKELFFTVFKHDVTTPFTQPFLKKVDAIVSEWRLWPVINNQLTHTRKENEWRDIIVDIDKVYVGFIENFHAINPDATIVITYPQRTFREEDMSLNFQKAWRKLGYAVENIGVYKRRKQYTGRRVIRLSSYRS